MHGNEYLSAIRVSGADAESFLQGQLTQDLRKAGAEPVWAGYCSAKGRLLALMQVTRDADGFSLLLHHSVAEATLKRLRMFVLRSKVALELSAQASALDESAWRTANIRAGIPVIYPQTSDRFVPQMVNLDRLGGISFDKGCYTGQEIVARLHYLGNLKKRLFVCEAAGAPPEPGSAVLDAAGDGQAAGEVVDSVAAGAGIRLTAVLQLDRAQLPSLCLASGAALRVLAQPI